MDAADCNGADGRIVSLSAGFQLRMVQWQRIKDADVIVDASVLPNKRWTDNEGGVEDGTH